ncbi:TPA: oligosaccharide flippase family protein, partial [Streptococcus suis]
MSSKSYILVKNTLIFSIANLGSKIIQFLLVPLYTFTLTTAEFGIVEFIMTVANLLTPLISCSISDGLLRFGLDKAEDGKIILTNSFAIVFIGTVISIFLLPILNLISNINQYLFFFLAILNIRIYRDLLS